METTLTALFIAASTQFGLPAGLLSSLCYVESGHNPKAVHRMDGHSDSIGICQIKLVTAQWMGFEGTAEDLKDPATNVYYAAAYLAYQNRRYGAIDKAVIAYNMGSTRGYTTTEYQVKVFRTWRGN